MGTSSAVPADATLEAMIETGRSIARGANDYQGIGHPLEITHDLAGLYASTADEVTTAAELAEPDDALRVGPGESDLMDREQYRDVAFVRGFANQFHDLGTDFRVEARRRLVDEKEFRVFTVETDKILSILDNWADSTIDEHNLVFGSLDRLKRSC